MDQKEDGLDQRRGYPARVTFAWSLPLEAPRLALRAALPDLAELYVYNVTHSFPIRVRVSDLSLMDFLSMARFLKSDRIVAFLSAWSVQQGWCPMTFANFLVLFLARLL